MECPNGQPKHANLNLKQYFPSRLAVNSQAATIEVEEMTWVGGSEYEGSHSSRFVVHGGSEIGDSVRLTISYIKARMIRVFED